MVTHVHAGAVLLDLFNEEQARISRRLALIELRRISNQAFFERINVQEVEDIDTVVADHGEPFDVLFHPALHTEALAYEARVQAGEDTQTALVEGLNIHTLVGPTGLEPMTSTV
jgi:hypothetical protein